jgi:hypothetical protein
VGIQGLGASIDFHPILRIAFPLFDPIRRNRHLHSPRRNSVFSRYGSTSEAYFSDFRADVCIAGARWSRDSCTTPYATTAESGDNNSAQRHLVLLDNAFSYCYSFYQTISAC